MPVPFGPSWHGSAGGLSRLYRSTISVPSSEELIAKGPDPVASERLYPSLEHTPLLIRQCNKWVGAGFKMRQIGSNPAKSGKGINVRLGSTLTYPTITVEAGRRTIGDSRRH
jgi:hypothetical protein